jgi:hypothetical protein
MQTRQRVIPVIKQKGRWITVAKQKNAVIGSAGVIPIDYHFFSPY